MLNNLSIVIPFMRDSDDREENVNFLIDYIRHHFEGVEIVVGESGSEKTVSVSERNDIVYKFYENHTGIYHNTKIKNDLVRSATNRVVAINDCDCIVSPDAYIKSTSLIHHRIYSMVYPYGGRFMECGRNWLPDLRREFKFDTVPQSELNCLHPNSCGGIIFVDKEKFLSLGGYHESMIGWGFEDDYLYLLGTNFMHVGRLPHYILHIEHWRGKSSSQHHEYYQNNMRQFFKMKNMDRESLARYLAIPAVLD